MEMHFNPLVSVVVTTYNRKEVLIKNLSAILSQSYTRLEIIVVDNYSDYDFDKVISSFNDDRLIGFKNHNNGIIAVNRNFGIQHISGEYIAFCDDDDFWMVDKVEKQVNYINDNKLHNEKLVIYTNCINHYISTGKKKVTQKKEIKSINDFIYQNHVTFSSSLVSLKDLSCRFKEDPEFFAVEDFLFWCTLKVNNYEFHLLEEPLLEYSVTATSSSMLNYGVNHLRSILVLIFLALNKGIVGLNLFKVAFSLIMNSSKYLVKILIKRFTNQS